MEPGVNEKYYTAAVRALGNLKYYYESLQKDVVAYLKHYFPKAKERDLLHAIDWAIVDVFGDGCEIETP